MKGKFCLYIDQYDNRIWASTRKELAEKAGGGRIHKMYHDKNGIPVHIGYVIGKREFTRYMPYEGFAQGILKAL